MLPKNSRLNLKLEFKKVVQGKNLNTPYLNIYYLKEGGEEQPKIGVAVNSKIFKKAYQRNQVKRFTFNVFVKLYQQLPNGLKLVALPKEAIFKVKSEELLLNVKDSLTKAGLIND